MITSATRWARARRAARRLAGDRDGAAAVEFALIAAPFFFLMFGIIEVALLFFANVTLENATATAARDIRTGQFQAGGGGAEEFRLAVCGLTVMLRCDDTSIDVRTFSDFGAINMANPINEDGEFDESAFGFLPGQDREIVLVRVFYEWNVTTPLIGRFFSNLSGNRRLLSAGTAFRNEPFGD